MCTSEITRKLEFREGSLGKRPLTGASQNAAVVLEACSADLTGSGRQETVGFARESVVGGNSFTCEPCCPLTT